MFLKDRGGFRSWAGAFPKVLLIVGPRVGKPSWRAIAGETVVPFFSISGSDFVENVRRGRRLARPRPVRGRVRSMRPVSFSSTKSMQLAVARAGLGGGHDEQEQTLNQLLVENGWV